MENEVNMFDEMSNNNEVSMEEAVSESNSESVEENSVFDMNKLSGPQKSKYERVDLTGQTVTVKKAEIRYPNSKDGWIKSKKGTTESKNYIFMVYYDTENNDRESYSGVKGFKQNDGSLGNPSIHTAKNKTQAARLFNVYKKHIMDTKNIDEETFTKTYGLQQFFAFLNSKPKAKMEIVNAEWDDKIYPKNTIVEFV